MRKSGSLALLLGLAAAGPALAAGAEAAGSNTGTILGLYLLRALPALLAAQFSDLTVIRPFF